jgi:hypothetical protein
MSNEVMSRGNEKPNKEQDVEESDTTKLRKEPNARTKNRTTINQLIISITNY